MVEVSIGFILENSLTALILIVYLAYEIHFGRLNKLATQMDSVIDVLIALSRTNDEIDSDAVSERLNGDSPRDLFIEEEDE